MALVYQQNINDYTKLGVWHITEPATFFLEKVVLKNNISHPHKQLQHLAGRYLIKELFPEFPIELIKIADTKKPFLADDRFHFSISHCGDFAAVMVSTKNRVGVDIEIPQDKIDRIKHKFLSEEELIQVQSLSPNPLHALTISWSIKEAMYKWYGAGKVDFKGNMQIQHIRPNDFAFIADCLFTKEKDWHLQVHSLMFNEISLAYLLTEAS